MKIGNSSEVAAASVAVEKSGTASQKRSQGTSTTARPAATPSSAPEASTQLDLSSTATQLLQGTGAQSDTFDAAKVARITQAISEGKFSVNADAIADKLLSNAQEVLGSRNSNSH